MIDRIAMARQVIDFGLRREDLGVTLHRVDSRSVLETQSGIHADLQETQHDLANAWPGGLAPIPAPIDPPPDPDAALPQADYLVITWTAAELAALADVLTPGVSTNPSATTAHWHPYTKSFVSHYAPLIRKGAPALAAQRLASYMPTKIGDKSVLCVKSELHLNQDGLSTGVGTATLPVGDFVAQIITEVQPKLVISTGTAGAVYPDHELGDVMVTRSAKFRARREFKNEPWANQQYKSQWDIKTGQFATATTLLALHANRLIEPNFAPPTTRYAMRGGVTPGRHNTPDIKLDGRDFPEFHPILTTDYFEFGTSTNRLEDSGCGVEMGDAVLGLATSTMVDPPRWLVVRNASDPQINGQLQTKPDVQAMWALFYYQQYGYWTSVSSAITCWAVIAGD